MELCFIRSPDDQFEFARPFASSLVGGVPSALEEWNCKTNVDGLCDLLDVIKTVTRVEPGPF